MFGVDRYFRPRTEEGTRPALNAFFESLNVGETGF